MRLQRDSRRTKDARPLGSRVGIGAALSATRNERDAHGILPPALSNEVFRERFERVASERVSACSEYRTRAHFLRVRKKYTRAPRRVLFPFSSSVSRFFASGTGKLDPTYFSLAYTRKSESGEARNERENFEGTAIFKVAAGS